MKIAFKTMTRFCNYEFSFKNKNVKSEKKTNNEGIYRNGILSSGTCTVPVQGIYRFDFSGVKDYTVIYLGVHLHVNGANIGVAWTSQTAKGSYDSITFSTSLRLAAGDRVNLFKHDLGVLHDNPNHQSYPI